MSDVLDSKEATIEYIRQVLEDGDTDEMLRAIGYIAKARGMAQVAKDAGLGRESLYKALRPGCSTEVRNDQQSIRCRRTSHFSRGFRRTPRSRLTTFCQSPNLDASPDQRGVLFWCESRTLTVLDCNGVVGIVLHSCSVEPYRLFLSRSRRSKGCGVSAVLCRLLRH
ncbi:addiction module antidote protein [Luteibacter rhizovicinus]|uniref:addiction module antidote protein n=1 Tax=Luteibacter rhizovicinus TaxID=242606 RepID=UPI001FB39645|nr:addiction module antidote protein [Luteibacter rhizovicinus]